MNSAFDWLNNRSDHRVQEALKRRCGICHVPPGKDCQHPWETSEPLGRIVHLERAQKHLDKRKRTA